MVRDRKKILIVDDEEPITQLFRTVLSLFGYEAVEVFSGSEALGVVAQESPDLVILDVAMPGMDGLEVCRRLKAASQTKSIPVLMISALALEQDRKLALEAGADGFLFKPFHPESVVAEIDRLLQQVTGAQ
jgi:DNA-binding response OmpR family regulator